MADEEEKKSVKSVFYEKSDSSPHRFKAAVTKIIIVDEWFRNYGSWSFGEEFKTKNKKQLPITTAHLSRWFLDTRPVLEHAVFIRLQDINITLSLNLPKWWTRKRKRQDPRQKSISSATAPERSLFNLRNSFFPENEKDVKKQPRSRRKSVLDVALDSYRREGERLKMLRKSIKHSSSHNLEEEARKLDTYSTKNLLDYGRDSKKMKVQFRLQQKKQAHNQSLYEALVGQEQVNENNDVENMVTAQGMRNAFQRKQAQNAYPKSVLKTRIDNKNTSRNSTRVDPKPSSMEPSSVKDSPSMSAFVSPESIDVISLHDRTRRPSDEPISSRRITGSVHDTRTSATDTSRPRERKYSDKLVEKRAGFFVPSNESKTSTHLLESKGSVQPQKMKGSATYLPLITSAAPSKKNGNSTKKKKPEKTNCSVDLKKSRHSSSLNCDKDFTTVTDAASTSPIRSRSVNDDSLKFSSAISDSSESTMGKDRTYSIGQVDDNDSSKAQTDSFHSMKSIHDTSESDLFHSALQSKESLRGDDKASRESRSPVDSFHTPEMTRRRSVQKEEASSGSRSVADGRNIVVHRIVSKRQRDDEDTNQNADTEDESQTNVVPRIRGGRFPVHGSDSEMRELRWRLKAQMKLIHDEITYLMDENAELQQSLMTTRTELMEKYRQEANLATHTCQEPPSLLTPFTIALYILSCLVGIALSKLCSY